MRKSCQIIINIEEPLKEAFAHLASRQGLSESKAGRTLVINELKARGVLPTEMAVNVLTD